MADLLKDIFYGYEIEDQHIAMRWLRQKFGTSLTEDAFARMYRVVRSFFSTYHDGVFGGQITAGDGLFVAAMMEKVRPRRMIEFGVASGYSSAFILAYAKEMGLAGEGTFLTSFDLVEMTSEGKRTGSFLRTVYPDLDSVWCLHTETTSADLMQAPRRFIEIGAATEATLAFIDGGHHHPWPTLDIACLQTVLPPDSWIVMQDYQMMERWLADCSLFGVPCPYPVRGVNLAVAHWPGSKIIGADLTYNCAAIKLDANNEQLAEFAQTLMAYPYETDFRFDDLIRRMGAPSPET